jgi:hypothetical protein
VAVSNVRISLEDYGIGGTYASDRATVGSNVAANLGRSERSRILLTAASHTSIRLEITFPSGTRRIGCIALFGGFYCTSADIEVWNGSAWVSYITNVVWTDGVPNDSRFSPSWWSWGWVHWPSGALDYSGVRVTMRGPSQQWHVSRLWAGDVWSPGINAGFPLEQTLVDASTHIRTAGGSLRTKLGPRSRRLSIPFNYLTDGDLDLLYGWHVAGLLKRRDRLVSVFPGAGSTREVQGQWLGRITSDVPLALERNNYWRSTLDFESL